MKYVEFLGIPGSGKTTVMQKALAVLQAEKKPVFSTPDVRKIAMRHTLQRQSGFWWQLAKIAVLVGESRVLSLLWEKTRSAYMIRFMHAYPRLSRQVIECAEHVHPPDWIPRDVVCGENLLMWLLGGVASCYQAAHQTLAPDDIFLMEEGFCQYAYYLLAFYQGNFDEQRLESYLNLIPKLDLLVALLPPPEECDKRLHSRPKGVASQILTPLSVEQRLNILRHRTRVNQKITEYMEKHHVPVVRLENTDYQTTHVILARHLKSFCSAQSSV